MDAGIYIPIISDYGFKATFGNEADSLFLRVALQALIKSETPIREVHFDKNAFEALTIDSRSGIFDLSCTDEKGNQFIVEMQMGFAPYFVQRMKFYALHKFNTLVERGEFDYANLPKLYAIAFLEKSILPTANFHTVANLRSEQGEIIDNQMSFITVELAKFEKPVNEVETDLEKLVYTMKTLHTSEPTQYPAFWNEEWLKRAIDELDTRKMSPEERAYFARITAANAEAVKAEKIRMEEIKKIAIQKALKRGKLTVEEIAEDNSVSVDFVLEAQRQADNR
ncbi:Rpn family recombination-promoting nuclease/putative transposase [Spirosoma panaciterrae]|uniref:Rpn family recombination-promoting nuclease/putative transposase n=1 Tax=Spirosoma panaciterrae TaxID=496058 RepID=UPI00037B9B8E|nr:Rpn family recombination-promoting nuclease/putative transposase [Spirosoma panaciterrae]